jgi:hypothetical protein
MLCNRHALEEDALGGKIMTDRYIDEHGVERLHVDWAEMVDYEEGDWDPNDPYLLKAEARSLEALKQQEEKEAEERAKAEQAKKQREAIIGWILAQ